jgi:hypothetical protein
MRHRPRTFETAITFTRANVVLLVGKDEHDVPDEKYTVKVRMTENRDGDGWIADVTGVESWDGEKWITDQLSLAEKLRIEALMVERQEQEDLEDEALEA